MTYNADGSPVYEAASELKKVADQKIAPLVAAAKGAGEVTPDVTFEMLKQLNEWLMLHTVGTWSHWGVLQAVECIIPSRNDIRMIVCDVPGFGTVKANPFRQSIVREMVVNCECSSLVLCLDGKRIDFVNKASADAFEEAGVYEALLGERLERRVGQVVTARCGNRIQTPLKPAPLAPSLNPPCACSNL